MARTTHDRIRDHEGIDLDTNIELDGATTSYADGDVLHDVISDLDDRIGTGGGGGLADLVTGDDQTFDASLGNWVNSGGTLTRDTSYKMYQATASAKFVATTAGQYIEVPITGDFMTGVDYAAVFYVSSENTSSTFSADATLGIPGGDLALASVSLNMSVDAPYVGDTHFAAYSIKWRPTSDHVTGVKFRFKINFSNSVTWHIGGLRVWQTPIVGIVKAFGVSYFPLTDESGLELNPWGGPYSSYGLNMFVGGSVQLSIASATYFTNTGLFLSNAYSELWTYHAIGDKTQEGIDITVGDDALGFFIGQKDSDTVQFYGDFDDYNFEFEDGATKGWKTTDGTNVSRLSLLHMIKTGTADPTAGGGVAHIMPSLYLRNNSNVTELWVATGTGATAWTKLNVP